MKPLRDAYRRYRFFQAVRLLERTHPAHAGVGAAPSPREEKIRFSARKGFYFPAGEISDVKEGDDGSLDMEVAFMGLVGPCGVLPNWYHELLLERLKAKDHAMADFYDLFHHRLITLFYRAWKCNNLSAQKRCDNGDRFSGYLGCLIGLGTAGLRGPLGPSEEDTLLFRSGQVSRRIPSACTIEQVVQEHFGIATEVEQFVARVVELELPDRTMLGEANSRLGVDTICGTGMRDCQSTLRLCLGPMTYRDFSAFLSGQKLGSLVSLARFMVGFEYELEVRLSLKREEVPSCRLGEAAAGSPRLGFSTWIKAADRLLDADPFVTIKDYEAEPAAH